ncbi:MAG: hypothetical protein LBT79_04905, partial [Elusimicrobiota bacterium]|nr:hypothetical protein [Elusimicrobiota bacterium]
MRKILMKAKVLGFLAVLVFMGAGGTAFGATDVSNFSELQNALNSPNFDIQLTDNITWTSVLDSYNSGAISGGDGGTFYTLNGASYGGFIFRNNQTVQFSGNINFNNFTDSGDSDGALDLEGGIVNFQTTSTFSNNQTGYVGAIFLDGGSGAVTKMTFSNSSITFINNVSQGEYSISGAIRVQSEAELEITNSYVNFINNKTYGPILGIGGGAISIAHSSSKLNVDNSKVYFSNNEAPRDGGAILVGNVIESFDIFASGEAIFTNSDVEFLGNTAGIKGGAIAVVSGSTLTFQDSNVEFRDNTAGTKGGAIYIDARYSNLQFRAESDNLNLSFSNNKANGVLNDIFVEEGGQLNFYADTGRTISIASGLISNGNANFSGAGTLLLTGRVDFNGISIRQGTVEVGNATLTAETINIITGAN